MLVCVAERIKLIFALQFLVTLTSIPRSSRIWRHQGLVVQSVVSLTSLLRVISLTVLADLIYNILIFFAEKM